MKLFLTTLLAGTIAAAHAVEPSRINWLVDQDPVVEPVTEEEPEQPEYWVSNELSDNEQTALMFFQKQGIVDKAALAVILGNIKQESKFHPNICEGGARVPYHQCHRGGYGLVQWTTSYRYWGLGNHAKQIGGDPSSFDTQLSYLVTEVEWKKALKIFKTPNKSLDYYMKGAEIWLGWGIYGNRGYYSQQYYNTLTMA